MVNVEMIKSGIKTGGTILKKYLPSILIGMGIGGMFAGTYVAVKATPEAHEAFERQREDEEQIAEAMGREPKKDIWARTKIVAKYYWSTGLILMTSAGCIVWANSVHLKREAALLAAAHMSQQNFEDLKNKIIELDGKKKYDKINDSLAQDKLDKNPTDDKTIIFSGQGEHLCYDAWSGRYFYTDIEKVRRAEVEMNRNLLLDNYFSLNDFYDLVGLAHIDLGDQLGWHCSDRGEQVQLDLSSKVTDKGEPCLVIRFDIYPQYEFDQFD